jgi:peptidyl-prolyl cis-trans isomerase C
MRIWQLGFAAGLMVTACNETESTPDKASATQEKSSTTTSNTTPPAASDDIGEVIANVNGVSIGAKDFERVASRKIPADGKSLSASERQEIIDQLVDEELLYQMAYERTLYRDPKVKKVMMNALLREEVYATIKGSDIEEEEMNKYYEDHKDEFTIPEKVQFSRILVKIKADRDEATAQAEAQRIYSSLKGNTDRFRDIAEKNSDGPYARRGGDVGFVSAKGKPGLDSDVVEKAFTLKQGSLSDPFVTKEGVNIIWMKERREEQVRSFKTAQGTVMRKMKNDKISEKYKSYTSSLRTGAKISVETEKINAIEIKSSPRPTLQGPGGPSLKLPKK